MFEFFWKQYEDLPDGVGYDRFSVTHLCILAVLLILIAAASRWFSKRSKEGKQKILRIIPFAMILLELFKDAFLIRSGHFSVGYLPLHLCSLGLFLFLFYALAKTDKWKGIFGEICATLILPGSVAALLFPDWTNLYPVWNFMNIYGFVWHGLLVLVPVMMLMEGHVHLSIRHIHYDYLFLLCIVPPVYIFDLLFDCNYMFLNWALKGTPLEWIASITGTHWYLAGYAVFSILVIGVIYLAIHIVHVVRGERTVS